MKQENSPSVVVSEPNSSEASQSSTGEDVQRHWEGVVKRRLFLKGLGIASATLSAGALLTTEGNAQATRSTGKLSKGDAALLRFAAAAELIEPWPLSRLSRMTSCSMVNRRPSSLW